MNSIPKIYTLGSRFNAAIFNGPVVIEEKIDGSQFQFGIENGQLVCRSKGQVIDQANPGMFALAVESAKRAFTLYQSTEDVVEGYVFQCEFLAKPKHNVLAYDRTPKGNLMLFDVKTDTGIFCDREAKQHWANILSLECVPQLYAGPATPDYAAACLDAKSVLGGPVEGIVIKNYGQSHPESSSGTSPMTAKIVRAEFKERHQATFVKKDKSGYQEAVVRIGMSLRTTARWHKAIQHLREAGQLSGTEKDIGPLVREIQRDTFEEEAEAIKQELFAAAQRDLGKSVVTGFAEFYKNFLNEGPTVFEEVELGLKKVA